MTTSDREDVSDFRPTNTELRSTGMMTEALVSTIGGNLINTSFPRSQQDRDKDISDAKGLAEFIEQA
jgi:hypothetical protein